MDKAYWATMHWGNFRWTVTREDGITLLTGFKNLSSSIGSQIWDKIKKAVINMGLSLNVTKRTLSLGSADSVTGWYAKSYSESTIEMIILPKGTSSSLLPPGAYVRSDALGLSVDGVLEGDEIKDSNNVYYEVKSVREHYLGNSFIYRESDLSLLPFKNLTGGTYTSSSVEDARYRTKVYLQTYLSSSALPNYIVAYGEPDYPLVKVFKEKSIDLIFSIGKPNITPMIDSVSQAAYGYEEHVPIQIFCIDKGGITGTKLKWQAETELRRICETYPAGSLRSLERSRDNDQNLGSTILYSTEYVLVYERDTT